MDFADYEQQALTTAIYPGQGKTLGLMYASLKLAEEAGECAGKVGKMIRDEGLATKHTKLNTTQTARLVAEVGDVLWYIAALARELDVPLEVIARANINKLQSRQARGTLSGEGDDR